MVILTNHGEKQTRKRNGLKKKAVNKDVENAMKYGLTHAEAKGRLCKFLNKLYLSHRTANNMRVYKGNAYIFLGEKLITMIALPGNLRSAAAAALKRKEKEREKENDDLCGE